MATHHREDLYLLLTLVASFGENRSMRGINGGMAIDRNNHQIDGIKASSNLNSNPNHANTTKVSGSH